MLTDNKQTPSVIKVGIVGVGNCARSLLEAIVYVRTAGPDTVGVTRPDMNGYTVDALDVCLAFDVNELKVGKDIAAASLAEPNCTKIFFDVPQLGVAVTVGPLADGLEGLLADRIRPSYNSLSATWEDVTKELIRAQVDVLVNYLPVGALEASKGYALAAAQAGVAFVNCTPAVLANDNEVCEAFRKGGAPLLGDDIKSHIGATLLHRVLIETLANRGVRIDSTYQLNFGGNMDFYNMTDPGRVITKKVSKMQAVSSCVPQSFPLTVGPSGYIEHLADRKLCILNIQATTLLGASLSLDVKLEVEDSPNSAGVVVDAIRAARLAADRGLSGPIAMVCGALFKSPPVQSTEADSLKHFNGFVAAAE